MNDRLAFLRAIRANPDDDTLRLVFADWLDEHNDPLGEFVRVQIELEPIRYRIDNPRAVELHAREDALMRRHGGDWLATNALLTNPADYGPVYRRGLPERACLSLDTFLRNGEALFAAHPTLREVALYGLANRCDELTLCPLLASLETLEIADWPTADDAGALAVSPHLDRVPNLKVWVGPDTGALLSALVDGARGPWPADVELVQIYGGAACMDRAAAGELDAAADGLAHDLNARLGRAVARVTRPFEQLFPLCGEVGKNVCAGRLSDGRPAVAAADFGNWVLVTFGTDGLVQEIEVRAGPVRRPRERYGDGAADLELGMAFVEWVDEDLRLELGPIAVHEFGAEDLELELLPYRLRDRAARPSAQPPANWSESDWRDASGQIRGWLENRNFVLAWHGTNHADWRGVVHSS